MAKKKKLSDEDIVQISHSYVSHTENAMVPIKEQWDRVWNLYNNKYDFSRKAEWQSQTAVPKIPDAHKQATGIFKRALIKATDIYTVDSDFPAFRPYAIPVQNLIKTWFGQINFNQSFVDSLSMGLLCHMMIFKIFWRQDEFNYIESAEGTTHDSSVDVNDKGKEKINPQQQMLMQMFPELMAQKEMNPAAQGESVTSGKKGSLMIVPINPYFFGLDPTGRNKYVYHKVYLDVGDFSEKAKECGYASEFLKDITDEDYSDIDKDFCETSRMGTSAYNNHPRKQVLLTEFWGDIIDADGTIVNRNCTWTVANDKYLVRKPIPNFFLHNKWPFVYGPIVRKPFTVFHKGFFEDIAPMAESLTELYNVLMDSNSYAMAKLFEVDLDLIEEPEDLKSGIYPGKVLKKRSGGNPNTRLVQDVTLGTVPAQGLRMYQEIDRLVDSSTMMFDLTTGKPSSRARVTATEAEMKGSQGMNLIEDIAMDVEDFIISPMIDMVYKVLLQFQEDFDDPRLVTLSEQVKIQLRAIAYLSDEEKKKYMDVFKFKCRGMSGVIARANELSKLAMLMKNMSSVPGAMDWLKMDSIWKKVVESFNWDAQEFIRTKEEYEQNMQMQIQRAQASAAPKPQPGQPPAGGAGPKMPQMNRGGMQ